MQCTDRSLAGEGFKYLLAKNYVDKLFKEEQGRRDAVGGFALYCVCTVWRVWKKGLFRVAASGLSWN